MASTSSTRSESPVDIDFSVIRTSIQMGHKMIDQILQGIHYGSEEVRNLLREECDFILECKVCRNLFRSFPNFVAHKRVYCMEYYEEKLDKDNLAPVPVDEETVIIHPEAPEEDRQKNRNENSTSKNISNIEKVVNKTFDGKSKEYQLYTKVAEDLEKRKATKLTNTVVLTPMAATANAVVVTHAKGDKSSEMPQRTSPKKQSPVKSNEEMLVSSLAKKKNSVLEVCADLAKKRLMLEGKSETVNVLALKTKVAARCRKSSPRKSTEYLEMSVNESSISDDTEEVIDIDKWNGQRQSPERMDDTGIDKELLKFCDLKSFSCKACKKKCTSLYNLRLHAKIKHGVSFGKFPCSICQSKFEHLKSLYKHLRQKHNKGEQYISKIKDEILLSKSPVRITEEVKEDSGSSTSSSTSPVKETKSMLSFSTGWKKCDKCGKVCWKAKSFYRHYSQCKGQGAKSESNSSIDSIVKSGKQYVNGSQKNTTALLKLQEKLRAGVIQPDTSDVKSKIREKNLKNDSDIRNANDREKASAERSVDSIVASTELYKALTQPMNVEIQDKRSKLNTPSDSRDNGQLKSYNLRLYNQKNEKDDKISSTSKKENHVKEAKVMKECEKSKEVLPVDTPALKRLEEKLVRQAGLKETQKSEIKLLEEKLTREALGHEKDSNVKEASEIIGDGVKEKNDLNESKKIMITEENIDTSDDKNHDTSNESDKVLTGIRSKEAASGKTENRKEIISERLREKMTGQEHMPPDSKARSSRSVSRDSEQKVQEKTPEKLNLMTNLSPMSSPGRSSVLPSSPTPSLQSNSGDSYNMKFKMTVQEMAELVESASLTKFAKERKKRAKSFLNSKQVKDSQKIAASLSKPMKRGTRKKNIIIRNLYGTRNKTPGSVPSKETKFIPSTRLSENKAEGNDLSMNSQQDEQGAKRRLSREQKRLQNSAGFVEKNYYAVSSSRESSKDRHSDVETEKKSLSRERKRLENSQGLVVKGFHYESDSYIEKDKRSVRKADKGASHTEKNADGEYSGSDRHVSTNSKLALSKNVPESNLDLSTESTEKENGEAIKQENVSSSKNTVLYVRKDLTEKIRNIQRRGSDTLSETENVSESEMELRSKTKADIDQTDLLLGNEANDQVLNESAEESSEKPNNRVEKVQKSNKKSGESNEADSPKHRTRLATGSIFFDSELLKMSPTKIEKKFAEINKAKDVTKGRQNREEQPKEALLVRKRLSLSPKKVEVEKRVQHFRAKSGPQRFSLATGVKQCQKCHKTFWKKRAYVFHLVNSSCSDKSLSKLDRKRALSLSPEGIVTEGGRFSNVKRIFKKPKRDVSHTDNMLNDNKGTAGLSDKTSIDAGKEPVRMTRIQGGCATKSLENTDVSIKRKKLEIGNKENDEVDKNEHGQIKKISEGITKEPAEQQKDIEQEYRSLRKRMTDDKAALNDQDKTVDKIKKHLTGRETHDDPSSANVEMEGTGSKICKDVDIKKTETVIETEITEKSKDSNKRKDVEVKSDILVLQGEASCSMETTNEEQLASNVSTKVVSEEGPSTSLSSLFTDDSDDGSSDFSGFSEEDLKVREQELSQMDVGDEESGGDPDDNDSENDLEELSDFLGSGHDLEPDPNPKLDSQSTSTTQRPVRKSAQNRFAHVEEIWVYKEPGKPVIEKTKFVKNREYVMDVTNPSKLHCHNSKDVDRLIDEKNLKCIQCETPCTSISNLRRHVIRHLGWKRYKCKHCAYTCYDMSYCRQHVLRAHDENLTNKNFHKFITDLKKEATKKRAAKRTNTLQKSKQNSVDEETYKKTRTNAIISSVGPSVNTEQRNANIPVVADSKSITKSLRNKDIHLTSAENEKASAQSDVVIKVEPAELSSVSKDKSEAEIKTSIEKSPLDRARMNLVKALRDK